MKLLQQHIEAIIFASEHPVSEKEISDCLITTFGWDLNKQNIQQAIVELEQRYEHEMYSFHLVQIGGGYHFMTKADYYSVINTLLEQRSRKRLSTAALETLSIIAYKQPVTKAEMEQIRGVNCDYTVQKLLEKDLISISGRADGPGKPLLYKTSPTFMDYFGINSPKDLPKLRELEQKEENAIGQEQAIEFEEAEQAGSENGQATEEKEI